MVVICCLSLLETIDIFHLFKNWSQYQFLAKKKKKSK